jgi:hypothetical protein
VVEELAGSSMDEVVVDPGIGPMLKDALEVLMLDMELEV